MSLAAGLWSPSSDRHRWMQPSKYLQLVTTAQMLSLSLSSMFCLFSYRPTFNFSLHDHPPLTPSPKFMRPQDEGFNVAPCPAFELSRSDFQNCLHIATRRQLLPQEDTSPNASSRTFNVAQWARHLPPSTSIELYNINFNLPLVYLLYRYLHTP